MSLNDFQILIADDDSQFIQRCLGRLLDEQINSRVIYTTNPEDTIAQVLQSKPSLVFLDVSFSQGGLEGLELVTDILTVHPNAEIIMLSDHNDTDIILTAMERGAVDYLHKGGPNQIQDLVARIKNVLTKRHANTLNATEGELLASSVGAVFESQSMREVFSCAALARRATDLNVFISGPSGVGKELVAQAISRLDEKKPFKKVNCAAFTSTLLISELFGHEKGAFTGANSNKIGLFESANGGDIFLDEVARLSLEAQAALLRVLQSGEFNPVGSVKTKKVKVRVIAATNENLENMVQQGLFREDLVARLKGINIEIPPLESRPEDIKPIIAKSISSSDKPKIRIAPDCLKILQSYRWPRNVRELTQTIKGMIALGMGDILTVGDLPKNILQSNDTPVDLQVKRIPEVVEKVDEGEYIKIPIGLSWRRGYLTFANKFMEAKAKKVQGNITKSSLARAMSLPRTNLRRIMEDVGFEIKTQAGD